MGSILGSLYFGKLPYPSMDDLLKVNHSGVGQGVNAGVRQVFGA